MSGLSFSQEDNDNQKISANELIVALGAITGCALPNTNQYLAVVINLLIKFITEHGYGDLTFDEMLLAFELNMMGDLHVDGDVIEFSGMNFNIAFVAKVFKRYMSSRNIVDGKIKNTLHDSEY